MSAPAVGGAIALWLQACPTLSPNDVLKLLNETSIHPDVTLAYPNCDYGYGQIDVYAGLLSILGLSNFPSIPSKATMARLTVSDNSIHISLPQPCSTPLPLIVYDLSARPVISSLLPVTPNTDYTLPLPTLPAGVYAVRVGDGSTLIRVR